MNRNDGTSRCDCQFVCVNRLIERMHPIGWASLSESIKEERRGKKKQMEMMRPNRASYHRRICDDNKV